jgi:hypothetical protein
MGSIITNDAECTRAINYRIAMAKTIVKKKKNLFTIKLDLKEETSEDLWSIALHVVLKHGHFET